MNTIKDYAKIILGCFLFSLSVSIFLSPCHLAPGGASGISIIINTLTGFPVGTAVFLINIPLLILSLIYIGGSFVTRTIFAVALSSAMTDAVAWMVKDYLPIISDTLVSAVIGGVLMGMGIGFVMKSGGTTGGTDIVAKLLRKKHRNIKTGTMMLIVDSFVIVASVISMRDIESGVYAVIALIITGRVLDMVLYGTESGKLLVIITKFPQKIQEGLLKRVDTGITELKGIGSYTGEEKTVMICVVRKHAYLLSKDTIKEADPDAFVIVTSATEVYGNRYKRYEADEL